MIDRNLDIKKQFRKLGLKKSKEEIKEILNTEFWFKIHEIENQQKHIENMVKLGIVNKKSYLENENNCCFDERLKRYIELDKMPINNKTIKKYDLKSLVWLDKKTLFEILKYYVFTETNVLLSENKNNKIKKLLKKSKLVNDDEIFYLIDTFDNYELINYIFGKPKTTNKKHQKAVK